MLVLLDRDGVINEDIPDTGVVRMDQLRVLDGAASAIARLRNMGAKVAIVTNQSCVGKGLISQAMLDSIHATLRERLQAEGADWDALYFCPDAPEIPSDRRKPAPGMLREAIADFNASPAHTPFVGDAITDMEAGAAAGCPRYLVRTGKGEATEAAGLPASVSPVCVCDDISQAANRILTDFQWLLR